MPDGWPVSLWFFAITAFVYLLQRFPLTGVFLMVFGAAFWSILFVNAGMVGLVFEGATGRVNPLWLLVPVAYFGGYYWLYWTDQQSLEAVAGEVVQYNAGKTLAFDPQRTDLVLEGVGTGEFASTFGLARVFDSEGRIYLIGTAETCELLRNNPVFESAGVHSHAIVRKGSTPWKKLATGFCTITMPGKPDKGVVHVTEVATASKHGRLPLALREFTARDRSSGSSAAVRLASASALKRFPMPVMGCALNSGGGSWDCFHGFMRSTVQLPRGMPPYSGGAPMVAKMLGLQPTQDLAAVAVGPERFRPMAERAEADLVARELAILERMLADPLTPIKNDSFSHLPIRPDVLTPYAGRIFDALAVLQRSDLYASGTGRGLWRLVAALPEPALAPHRAQMVEWMKPGTMRPWTDESWQLFPRLDVTDPVQRNIVLTRLESPLGDIPTNLLPPFCRMGAAAPEDAKQRLLAVWRARGEVVKERASKRGRDHLRLYLTLARMGLKEQAGRVEQRYMGDTFAGIWNEVTAATPADICDLPEHELIRRFRKKQ